MIFLSLNFQSFDWAAKIRFFVVLKFHFLKKDFCFQKNSFFSLCVDIFLIPFFQKNSKKRRLYWGGAFFLQKTRKVIFPTFEKQKNDSLET
jgi:hypothetical protein